MEDQKIIKRAEKYGYCGLFALNNHKMLQDRMNVAMEQKDSIHLILCLGLLTNRMAYDRAKEVIELEEKK